MLNQPKNQRRRGVILTMQGFQKLNQAKSNLEITENYHRCTLEILSAKTGLTPNTLSKVLGGSVGVDLHSLRCCFFALNLTLTNEDYIYLKKRKRIMKKDPKNYRKI
jgi:hypothetical protein